VRSPERPAHRRELRYLVALGSNLGDRGELLCEGRELLRRCAGGEDARIVQQSRLYESPAWGDPGGPPFLNAVLELATDLAPRHLLRELRGIEAELGRPDVRRRNAPRILDLDLIAAEKIWMTSLELSLPHPRLWRREFVLRPLEDLEGVERFFPFGMPERGTGPIEAVQAEGW
jgi:2-amino-4-hydroxy-6-hydroxymethyldihydropteridine diphosphokinase